MAIFNSYFDITRGYNYTELLWVKQCRKTIRDWEWLVYTTYKNGDDWGVVFLYCLIHLTFRCFLVKLNVFAGHFGTSG